jgi:hypothetical protein
MAPGPRALRHRWSVEQPDRPEAEEPNFEDERMLYGSTRHWWAQLKRGSRMTFSTRTRATIWCVVLHRPVGLRTFWGGPRMLVSRPACLWSTTPRGAGPERRRASVNEEN